ncbi:hypothetical protein M758_10G095000 [Ceratodon purpureus]|nr:hypothetical protein M758_10G095000 [Ceratodon purpureus]
MGQAMRKHGELEGDAVPVRTGIDVLLARNFDLLRGAKVGVITNATGVFQNMVHLVDVLHNAEGVDMVAIFGPEHGFRSAVPEGSSEAFYVDKRTRVPVYDTYQKSGKKLMKLFEAAGVDLLLFDIQDVGARFYTYIWTLYDHMVAAAMSERPIKIVVTDRPNPLGGVVADGPVMEPAYSSFVGRKAIALRHGMTVGELARLFNAEFVVMDAGKQVDLEVVSMEGWHRSMLFFETKLVWVPPSPNIPSANSALLYMGMCLFEGTNCSEGRGTALPFELIGASYIDERLISYLQQQDCPGVLFREACFQPFCSKFSGTTINGIQTHILDYNAVNPLRTALTLIAALHKLYPDKFRWRQDGKSFWLDVLVGNNVVREMLSKGATADEVMASWQDDVVWFGATRSKYLLYN